MIKIPILTKGNDMISHFIKPVPGILVLGGSSASTSLEFLSTDNPGQNNCLLNNYPRSIESQPSTNFVAGKLVTCYGGQCEIYDNGVWSFFGVHQILKNLAQFSTDGGQNFADWGVKLLH